MVLFGVKNTLLRERKPALGQMAQGWYSYSHPKDENITNLKNLRYV